MKYLKTFNESGNPHLKSSINDILSYLEESKPKVLHRVEDNLKQTYYTKFNLNGEEIEISVEDFFTGLMPIVVINRWQENTGKNRKLLSVIKDILRDQIKN